MIFTPYFQPIKDVYSDSFVAAELLARWCQDGRVLSPSNLLTTPHWGLVDIEMAKFIQSHINIFQEQYQTIFINVSEQTLSSSFLFKAWSRIISSIPNRLPSNIVIEITEDIKDFSLEARWGALVNMDVSLALDDYGDKHSTFERLMKYDWQFCKFDAKRLETHIDDPAIIHCRKAGIQLVAEQVETHSLGERAKLFGMSWQQGFCHAKPADLDTHLNQVRA